MVAPAHEIVVPPTIGVEPSVAYAFKMGGHTSILVRTIGVYAQRGGNL
jgi:hypothetical protein